MTSTLTLKKSWCAQAIVFSLAATNAYSQSVQTNPDANDNTSPVVIIGSRFPNNPDLAPIGAQVITAAEIRDAGIDNVNEAVRKLGGVYGRKNLNSGTPDYDLDMNGFGEDSQNNLVVLIDGVRLSENEMAVAVLSSIPIDSVARVEIMHGGSSVLYGDGATGGVINVITKRVVSGQNTGSITALAGQFHDYAGRAYLTQGGDGFNATLNLAENKSDGYRVNEALTQKNAGATLTWFASDVRVGLRADVSHQDGGLPGAITLQQFEQDPKQSTHPNDNGKLDINRYTAFFEKTLDTWQAAAELSTRERSTESIFYSPGYVYQSSASGRQTEFTPRLRNTTGIDSSINEFVVGLDFINWNRDTNTVGELPVEATQKSKAIYIRDEIKIGAARLAAGARRELFEKSSNDPNQYATDNYNVNQGVNAWELQASYAFIPSLVGFAKVGQSYRVANVDDNSATAVANQALLPQLSHDLEIGATFNATTAQLTGRLFRHDITDEIYYDPSIIVNGYPGANVNLDPTRRQGVAFETKFQLSQQFKLIAQAQHVQAEFTGGVHDGKELGLVPTNTVTAHLNWTSGNGQSAYVGGQWVDSQRYGNDLSNSCSLVPSHTTLDARFAQTVGQWELAVSGTNLTNKEYFTNAFLSSSGQCQTGIYPDDGRQMKVSLRYSF